MIVKDCGTAAATLIKQVKTTATSFKLCFKMSLQHSSFCRTYQKSSRDSKWKQTSSTVLLAAKVPLFGSHFSSPSSCSCQQCSRKIMTLIICVVCYRGLQIKLKKKCCKASKSVWSSSQSSLTQNFMFSAAD